MYSSTSSQDELTSTFLSATQTLSASAKADFLLSRSIELIDEGRYGPDVERYLAVYLRTPNLPKDKVAKALLARANARKAGGEALMGKAQQDFQAVLKLHPGNADIQKQIRYSSLIRFANTPASQRLPPEIWDTIATHIPRYFLRTWLFVSPFHRDIAQRLIFNTIDIYFGDDQDNVNRGLDIFDRAKADIGFAKRVKSLRLHWAYEEGDLLDLMMRLFRTALPEFKNLEELEWIGYPECTQATVESIIKTHSHIQSLALIGWHFDAVGASSFQNLRKFTLRAEDDDGFAPITELRSVLDSNLTTLTHLTLGAYLARTHSWDDAFTSPTISNLTHLDLVDTKISHVVFQSIIMNAHRLRSLMLHGVFENADSAAVVFGADHVIEGRHAFLPLLEELRCIFVSESGEDGETYAYKDEFWRAVCGFVKDRKLLRRLDLGRCPWEHVKRVLPGLTGVRVLGVLIERLNTLTMNELVRSIPHTLVAVHVSGETCENVSLNQYATHFTSFPSLSFIHLQCTSTATQRPKPNILSEKEFDVQSELWVGGARDVAVRLKQIDFVGWNGEHYVVVRGSSGGVELKELPARRRLDCGKGVDLGSEDAAWLERKDVPVDYEVPSDRLI